MAEARTLDAEARRGSKRAYCKGYYMKNRETLSKKRGKRYAEDDEYRRKMQESSKSRYERLRKERIEKRGSATSESRGYNRPRLLMVNGKETLVHCVSEFADRVGRNVQTVTVWEQKGIIPPPTVVDEMRRRWYSETHMNLIASVAQDFHKQGGRSLEAFGDWVKKEWKKRAN